jgi:hypothetical protein
LIIWVIIFIWGIFFGKLFNIFKLIFIWFFFLDAFNYNNIFILFDFILHILQSLIFNIKELLWIFICLLLFLNIVRIWLLCVKKVIFHWLDYFPTWVSCIFRLASCLRQHIFIFFSTGLWILLSIIFLKVHIHFGNFGFLKEFFLLMSIDNIFYSIVEILSKAFKGWRIISFFLTWYQWMSCNDFLIILWLTFTFSNLNASLGAFWIWYLSSPQHQVFLVEIIKIFHNLNFCTINFLECLGHTLK